MKKVLIYISLALIIIGSGIIVAFLAVDKNTDLIIETADHYHSYNLGSYKVKNYKAEREFGYCGTLNFDVASETDFYNNILKKNTFYDSELEFEMDGYYTYGFFIIDSYVFKYEIKNNHVSIKSISTEYNSNYSLVDTISSKTYDTFNVIVPLTAHLYYAYFDSTSSYYVLPSSFEYKYYTSLSDKNITFDMLTKIYQKLNSLMVLVSDDIISLKGYVVDSTNKERILISSEYLIIIENTS